MKKYVFKPYSDFFPDLFLKERNRIFSFLKEPLIIEHVGSSAVPGLGGKGIIDIALGVNLEKKDEVADSLQDLGYDFRLSHSTQSRLFFKTQLPDFAEEVRTYHIHLMTLGDIEWLDMLFFRDYLKSHPEALQEYALLKEEASKKALEQGEKYRQLKEPFMKKIIKKRGSAF